MKISPAPASTAGALSNVR
jgi:hypothetical protein